MASWLEIFSILEAHANPIDAVAMEYYMKGLFPFLGIKTPMRRALTKDFLKKKSKEPLDWDFVDFCWNQDYREAQYLAMDYLLRKKKELDFEDIPKIKELILEKSWWDSSDVLDKLIAEIEQKDQCVRDLMLLWSKDENIWLRRISIIFQRHRKEKTDLKLLAKVIENNLGPQDFFIEKAIGWALRDYSKTDPLWVRDFIQLHKPHLSALSIREASKYF